ncbi:MAG: hypothetical protein GXP55_20990 [Deltaproteobacteria bacterium]|nr:hypothetical protein [Deltaproteobacteria bacterium]
MNKILPSLLLSLSVLGLTTATASAPVAHASDSSDSAEVVESTALSLDSQVDETPTPNFDIAMGEADTTYHSYGRLRHRAHNVELAASKLDGAILEPGGILSFNEQVGARGRDEGFEPAPVIASGRMRQGMGGGVCQVSTTLHVAALRAGLVAVERRPHSRPSHYVDPGLDATVVYGRFDYRIENPYPFAVRVRAHAENGHMHVRIEGAQESQAGELEAVLLRELAPREQIIEDASLAAGERVVVEEGRPGKVMRVRWLDAEGQPHTERVRYGAAARVVHVAGAPSASPSI